MGKKVKTLPRPNEEMVGYVFWCPGCNRAHALNNSWSFNGDLKKPTFNPSVKVTGTVPMTDEEYDKIMNGEKITPESFTCHSFIRDGSIQFLNDCTHILAGKTVEVPDWDDEYL
jgi:hypothetical protein